MSRWGRALVVVVPLLAGAVGGWMIWLALQEDVAPSEADFWVANPTPVAVDRSLVDPQSDPDDPQDTAAGSVDSLGLDRLLIPKIKVYAKVTRERIVDGEVTSPNHKRVGRVIDTAPLDASEGTTLIGGHVSAYGDPGALHDIYQLRAGDHIYVTNSEGVRSDWIVYASRTIPKLTVAPDLIAERRSFHDPKGERRLVLGTCSGRIFTSGRLRGHYEDNLFVLAKPASDVNR